MTSLYRSDRARAVALWLFLTAALVFAMVIVGGATRLTNAGLSITEWKPVTGALPPLSTQAWLAEFHKYQLIPQYRFVNRGMSLESFKTIYWWEWAHRLLGRVVGAVFAIPFFVLLVLKRIPQRLVWRCWLLLGLGGLQGLVGWWMVASGLADRVKVAPERLTIHLGLALVVFCLLVWTGLEAWAGAGRAAQIRRWPAAAAGLAALVFFQILLGGLVAGNDAGFVDNDWPLMNGRWWPADYLQGSLGHSLLHSPAAVQLHHRLGAYLLFLLAWTCAILALRSRQLPEAARGLALGLAVLVSAQAGLGIATLVNHTPLGLAAPHQALAAVVLATALTFAWRVRRA